MNDENVFQPNVNAATKLTDVIEDVAEAAQPQPIPEQKFDTGTGMVIHQSVRDEQQKFIKEMQTAPDQEEDVAPKEYGIAVLGSHPLLVDKAPFDDPNWEIWATSSHNLDYAGKNGDKDGIRFLNGGRRPDGGMYRVDQFFEVHRPILDSTRTYSYTRALDIEDIPVIWLRDPEALPLIPNGRMYPEAALRKRFGDFFFSSSIAYMLAMAIVELEKRGWKKLGIWGVLQGSQSEFTEQRPGIQYFIQRALDLDIEVIAPSSSALFEVEKHKW